MSEDGPEVSDWTAYEAELEARREAFEQEYAGARTRAAKLDVITRHMGACRARAVYAAIELGQGDVHISEPPKKRRPPKPKK